MTVVGEIFFALDNNVTYLQDNPQGISSRVFQRPEKLGANLIVQARF